MESTLLSRLPAPLWHQYCQTTLFATRHKTSSGLLKAFSSFCRYCIPGNSEKFRSAFSWAMCYRFQIYICYHLLKDKPVRSYCRSRLVLSCGPRCRSNFNALVMARQVATTGVVWDNSGYSFGDFTLPCTNTFMHTYTHKKSIGHSQEKKKSFLVFFFLLFFEGMKISPCWIGKSAAWPCHLYKRVFRGA